MDKDSRVSRKYDADDDDDDYEYVDTNVGKDVEDDRKNAELVEDALYTMKFIGVFYCLSSFGCFGVGVMTLWFSSSHLVFPYNTGSGVWTGICTFTVFILGHRIAKHFSITNPEHTKRKVIAYYTGTILTLTFSILHVNYSALGYQYCKQELRTGSQQCFTDEMPRLMLMGGFGMAFGAVSLFSSLFGTIYMSTGKRLKTLTGTDRKKQDMA